MDLKQIIKDAWEAVDAAGLPEHVQAAALQQAIALVAGPSVPGPAVVKPKDPEIRKGGEAGSAAASTEPPGAVTDEDAYFAKFAAESDVDEESLRTVYYVKNGAVRIAGTKNRLGSSEADRNRTVAMLAAASLWYFDGKPAISITDIRESIKAAGWEASRNLAKHLEDVAGTQVTGSGPDKGIRVQSGKFDAPFKAAIERLTTK